MIKALWRYPEKKAPAVQEKELILKEGFGIEGDHHADGGDRQISLLTVAEKEWMSKQENKGFLYLPKGTSFDKLTQTDIVHMMNHINSYRRSKLGNRTPYEAFTFYYGKGPLEKLGYSQIDPSCVVMTPKLFKR